MLNEKNAKLALNFIQHNTTLFRGISLKTLVSISTELSPVVCKSGEILIKQGDMGDELFIVIQGAFSVWVEKEEGEKTKVGQITRGDFVGEGSIITKEPRNATVLCESEGRLLKLSHTAFQKVLEDYPEELQSFVRLVSKRSRLVNPGLFRPSSNKLRKFLSSVELLSALDERTMKVLEPKMQWLFLPGGESLMQQFDPGESMYIVVNGRLRFRSENKEGVVVAEGEFSRGDIIGEMALLTGEKRSATVYSIRACELIMFSRKTFEGFIKHNPDAMFSITKVIAQRLQKEMAGGAKKKQRNIKIITLFPLGTQSPIVEFTRKLTQSLEKFGKVKLADKKSFLRYLVKKAANDLEKKSSKKSEMITVKKPSIQSKKTPIEFASKKIKYDIYDLINWLYSLENYYDTVLLSTDLNDSTWTETVLRHTDRILLVARHGDETSLSASEIKFLGDSDRMYSPSKELVIVYPQTQTTPQNTAAWLQQREVEKYHHIRSNNDDSYMRLARVITGNSIGIALGGGGAKGFAHIGLMKAFEQFGIPVDLIGGTSAGAIMAAFYALGYKTPQVLELARSMMVKKEVLNDYTLSKVSLIRGKKFTKAIQEFLRDTNIEDLWIPYFAVSTDLTNAKKMVFDFGKLWKAIRSSASLPGLLPPFYDEGRLLVDGALLNNVPGDILKTKGAGKVIAVSLNSIQPEADKMYLKFFDKKREGVSLSFFGALRRLFHLFSKDGIEAGIGSILMRSTLVNSLSEAHKVQDQADLFIELPVEDFGAFEWKKFDKIVDAGYQYALSNIDKWKAELGIE